MDRTTILDGQESAPAESGIDPAEMIRQCADWAIIAKCVYSFDYSTAKRLAFVRWLRLTDRIPDR